MVEMKMSRSAPQQGVREPFGLFGAIAAGVDDQIPVPPFARKGPGPRLCPREAGSAPANPGAGGGRD